MTILWMGKGDIEGVGTMKKDCRGNTEKSRGESHCSVSWPRLDQAGLTNDQRLHRLLGVGGSDANIIVAGDSERLVQLWREKRGEISPSLDHILPVVLGQWTEAFNRQWYERMTGLAVDDAGLVATSASQSWRRATLDGFVTVKSAVWEAKHVSAFAKPDEVLARNMPQLQHNMAVLDCEAAVLSVLFGNHKWEAYEVAADWLYQEELLDAEQRFWTCVLTGEVPAVTATPPAPRPTGTREICLEGNNAWAAAAADWLANANAAKLHASAAAALRELIEPDVTRAYGHGLEAKRSKAGAVTIKELAR